MPNIRDVSKLAGVSVATVSRVINQNGYVNEKTKQSVLSAMKTLNYTPSNVARSLAGKHSSTIALIVPDILNPFFPEVARAIEDAANEYGYSVLLCNSDHDADKESQYFEMLSTKRIDGLILSSYTVTKQQIVSLRSKGIPMVMIDDYVPDSPALALVSKNREGARMAVQHLKNQGCRKIAHIAGPVQIASARDRCLGYEDECKSSGTLSAGLIEWGNFHVDGGMAAMEALLDRHPDLDGVFAGNDLMAVGALKTLYNRGIRVPDQIKLVGFDGINTNLTVPELTTVAQPIYTIGHMATKHLMDEIRGKATRQGIHTFDVELKIGQTSS